MALLDGGPVTEKRIHLEVFSDVYLSSDTQYQKNQQVSLTGLHSVTLYAMGSNTQAVNIAYTSEGARARKELTLNPGGSSNISVSTSQEEFDLKAWIRNATNTTTQQVYVFGLRYWR